MIITRRVNDVKMRGKINAGLSSTFTFFDNSSSSLTVSFTIKEGVQDWFPKINVVKIVKDSHSVISLHKGNTLSAEKRRGKEDGGLARHTTECQSDVDWGNAEIVERERGFKKQRKILEGIESLRQRYSKDIRSLTSQSERAFNAIHCFNVC